MASRFRFAGTLATAALLAVAAVWGDTRGNASEEWQWVDEVEWLREAPQSSLPPNEQLKEGYALEKKGHYTEAALIYYRLAADHPETTDAGIALHRLAKCLSELTAYYPAFGAIEQAFETHPDLGDITELAAIELILGKLWLKSVATGEYFTPESPAASDVRRIIAVFTTVQEHDPSGDSAAEAHLLKGECHLILNETDQAGAEFKTVIDEFPESPFVRRARLGLSVCQEYPDLSPDE